MARVYANIFCAIWDDKDFCALSANAQRTYFMLVSQSDITPCGLLPLTLRRWGRTVAEGDRDLLPMGLDELEAARFVAIDQDREELLVRSFVRHDGGYRHGKRVLAVIASARAIHSARLRTIAAIELERLGVSTGIDVPSDSDSIGNQMPIDSQSEANQVPIDSDSIPTEAPSDRQSSGNRVAIDSHRVVVTEVVTDHNPQPTTLKPVPPSAARSELATVEPIDTTQAIIAEWQRHVRKRPPERVIGQTAKLVREMLAQGIDPDDVRRGVAAWSDKGLHPSTLPAVVHEVQNAAPVRTRDQQAADDLFDAAARRMGVLA